MNIFFSMLTHWCNKSSIFSKVYSFFCEWLKRFINQKTWKDFARIDEYLKNYLENVSHYHFISTIKHTRSPPRCIYLRRRQTNSANSISRVFYEFFFLLKFIDCAYSRVDLLELKLNTFCTYFSVCLMQLPDDGVLFKVCLQTSWVIFSSRFWYGEFDFVRNWTLSPRAAFFWNMIWKRFVMIRQKTKIFM